MVAPRGLRGLHGGLKRGVRSKEEGSRGRSKGVPRRVQGTPRGGVQSWVQGEPERSPSGVRGGSKQWSLMKSKEEGGPRKRG